MMCTTRTSGVSGWLRGEEQVAERNIFTPWIVLTGATVSSNGGGAAGKEVSPEHRCSSCFKHFCFQVTKDKMLAEKDEELRRMQEMLAQMQVGSGT